jgi:hypothetical protein
MSASNNLSLDDGDANGPGSGSGSGGGITATASLTPLEQDVLDEYARLLGGLNQVRDFGPPPLALNGNRPQVLTKVCARHSSHMR